MFSIRGARASDRREKRATRWINQRALSAL